MSKTSQNHQVKAETTNYNNKRLLQQLKYIQKINICKETQKYCLYCYKPGINLSYRGNSSTPTSFSPNQTHTTDHINISITNKPQKVNIKQRSSKMEKISSDLQQESQEIKHHQEATYQYQLTSKQQVAAPIELQQPSFQLRRQKQRSPPQMQAPPHQQLCCSHKLEPPSKRLTSEALLSTAPFLLLSPISKRLSSTLKKLSTLTPLSIQYP